MPETPDDLPARGQARRKPAGFRVSRDVQISTRSGSINIKAHAPVKDPLVIGYLKRSGVKLEPFYDD